MVCFVNDPKGKWELDVHTDIENVVITARQGALILSNYNVVVHPPNFIERFLGVTFEQKLEKAKKKVQFKIDKLNSGIERANQLVRR